MSNTTIRATASTFTLALGKIRSFLQLSIAARLAISFLAVAVLAVAANLIAEGKISALRTTEIRQERITPVALPPPPPPAVVTVEPPAAHIRPPFPSTDPVTRSLDRLDRQVLESTAGDISEVTAEYPKLSAELDRAAIDFGTAATAVGQPAPARFMTSIRTYRQQGADLLKLAAARRASIADYSTHLEQLNTRVKRSLGHAWNIFGRVVARQSLMKLTDDLDDLRRRYSAFIAADTADPSMIDALSASEGELEQALAQDRAAFTRADGAEWYDKSHDDLEAMSSARKALVEIDRQHNEGTHRFSDEGVAVAQIMAHMEKSYAAAAKSAVVASLSARHPRVARHGTLPATGHGASSGIARATNAGAANASRAPLAATPVADLSAPSQPGTQIQRSVSTTTLEPQGGNRETLVAWISGGVLLLVIYISAGTAVSIVRPVRRLLAATSRIARGETGVIVPRGGIRELDTLALAFNDMAAQLAIAQAAARDQHQLLETKVTERTLQLQELSQLDPLTRLANRRHFFTLLNFAIERAVREDRLVGVFFLDIDNFKNMNDSLGHAFGDHVLQTIAHRLAGSTRAFGFAARLGGDEFTVVYESAGSIEEVREAGLQLVHAFQQPVPLDGRELVVSVSVGASIFPEHGTDAETLLGAADAALFEAKALGRSQLSLFTPELREAALAKFSTEQGLRRAIDRGEFELAFQPEVNLQTCQTELVEALIRWRLPDGRFSTPAEFLGVAEASGLILQINDWVLRRVVETAARWYHGEWPEVRVAINVSSRQLFDNSFVEQVQALLEEHKLPPQCIEIELTENVLQTGSATIASLRRLRAHGIAIALDDFGTGFSSLASLEQLPLSRIKLDRSLVASIDTSARSLAIAQAIIQLCQGLGLSITAEGIERPEQLAPLVGYSALYAQGYLLAQPASADELLPIMATLPALTRSLIRSSITQIPEAQMPEKLPVFTAALNPEPA